MGLDTEHLDVLQELINIGIGQAASILNQMIGSHIALQVPTVNTFNSIETLQQELEYRVGHSPVSTVLVFFDGLLEGAIQLIFSTSSAASLVTILLNEAVDIPDLNALKIGTLSEIGNIVINGIMGSISTMLHHPLKYSIPVYLEEAIGNLSAIRPIKHSSTILLARTCFTSQHYLITGDIILTCEPESFNLLLEALDMELMQL